MIIQKTIFFILLCSLYACSDYPSGYREGYEGSDKKQWIVFGRGDYSDGYHSGLAEKFQDDWLLENPVNTNTLHCPAIVVRANTLMFLPAAYKEIAPNIYSSKSE